MITARYRQHYDGEFIITDTKYSGGMKIQNREFVANQISNQHISGRAAVIGQDISVRDDVVNKLENHKGGLLGQKKLQTYGCEGVWRKIRVDFYVDSNTKELADMVAKNATQNTVVYSTTRNCLRFPEHLYPIPYAVRLSPGAQAAYIAAFDGHQEVFILGVDGICPPSVIDTQSFADMVHVFQAYKATKFILVTDGAKPPEAWRNFANVDTWDYRKFIIYCDV
jgi:hypothetical protein